MSNIEIRIFIGLAVIGFFLIIRCLMVIASTLNDIKSHTDYHNFLLESIKKNTIDRSKAKIVDEYGTPVEGIFD